MGISFDSIILYSKKPEKLFQFLSFILDVEASDSEEGKISFHFSGVKFLILLTEDESLLKRSFILNTEEQHELLEIKQNIDFFYYRESNTEQHCHLINDQLSFADTDGSLWQIQVKLPLHSTQSSNGFEQSNVRIC